MTSYWRSHKREIAHGAFRLVAGVAIGAAAVALCVGTAGVGCVVAAGIAIGMPTMLIGGLAIDKAFRDSTTGREALSYLGAGISGPVVRTFVTKPATRMVRGAVKSAWRGARSWWTRRYR